MILKIWIFGVLVIIGISLWVLTSAVLMARFTAISSTGAVGVAGAGLWCGCLWCKRGWCTSVYNVQCTCIPALPRVWRLSETGRRGNDVEKQRDFGVFIEDAELWCGIISSRGATLDSRCMNLMLASSLNIRTVELNCGHVVLRVVWWVEGLF